GPARGRFRHSLTGVPRHLAPDHPRAARRRPQPLPQDFAEPAVEDEPEADAAFRACWRDELLAHAWQALAEVEKETGQPLCTVLRFRAENPDLHSPEMAGRLGELLGRELTPVNVRQLLHRARERFAELLLEEVRATLTEPTDADLHEELVEVGLFEYCRPALERR